MWLRERLEVWAWQAQQKAREWLESWWAFLDEVNAKLAPHWLPLLAMAFLLCLAALLLTLAQEGAFGR